MTQLSVEPGDAAAPAGGGDYQVVPVTMQFNGTYDQMQDFLLRMRNLARLVTVTDVSYCRVPVIDDEHSCPVQPADPVEEETTTLNPGVESPLLVELQADVYFQPEGVPSGAETTAPTPQQTTTPSEPAEETGGG